MSMSDVIQEFFLTSKKLRKEQLKFSLLKLVMLLMNSTLIAINFQSL